MKHGGNIATAAKAYGFNLTEMIDLSTGISPKPYPIEDIDRSARHWRDLPQIEAENSLIDAMKTYWLSDSLGQAVTSAEIVLAPGSGIVINLAALLRPKTTVMIPNPAYSEHEIAWANQGHVIETYDVRNLPDLTADARVVITVQPANPTGHITPPHQWQDLINRLAERDGLLVVDEAFIDVMPEYSMASMAGQKGLLIIRSFGKFYGLAGLRLGAAIGHGDDIKRLRQLMGPWAVSTPALDIGIKAVSDLAWADQHRQWLEAEQARLHSIIERHGFKICGGTSLYALVEYDQAEALHHHLAQYGIWTRIFDHHPNWIRFGLAANREDFERLASALQRWRQDGN